MVEQSVAICTRAIVLVKGVTVELAVSVGEWRSVIDALHSHAELVEIGITGATSDFLERDALIVEQIHRLHGAPHQNELLEGKAYEYLHRLREPTLLHSQCLGHQLGGM